jgi:hypothetical protein
LFRKQGSHSRNLLAFAARVTRCEIPVLDQTSLITTLDMCLPPAFWPATDLIDLLTAIFGPFKRGSVLRVSFTVAHALWAIGFSHGYLDWDDMLEELRCFFPGHTIVPFEPVPGTFEVFNGVSREDQIHYPFALVLYTEPSIGTSSLKPAISTAMGYSGGIGNLAPNS